MPKPGVEDLRAVPNNESSLLVQAASAVGGLVIFLYALGGLVLAVRFSAVGLPPLASVEHVSRANLAAIGVSKVAWLVVAVGAISLLLSRALGSADDDAEQDGERPSESPRHVRVLQFCLDALIPVGFAFLPFGFTSAAVGLGAAALLATYLVLQRGERAQGWQRKATAWLVGVGALAATVVSVASAYEPPFGIDVVAAYDKHGKRLTAGYLVAETGDAVYVGVPGARAGDVDRKLEVIRRDDVVLMRIRVGDHERPQRKSLVGRLIHNEYGWVADTGPGSRGPRLAP